MINVDSVRENDSMYSAGGVMLNNSAKLKKKATFAKQMQLKEN